MEHDMNKAIVSGNLGRAPEVKYTGTGVAVCTLSIATNETWKDKAGVPQKKTDWHRVVVWNKLAELCGEYLEKGSKVLVEGKMQTREWNDKDGVVHYSTEIVASQVEFLSWSERKGEPPAPSEQDMPPRGERAPF
jgi:single-strand DNA-binding protein